MIMIVTKNLIPCQPLSHSTRVLLIREMVSELCKRSCNLVRVILNIAVLCLVMVMMVTTRMMIVIMCQTWQDIIIHANYTQTKLVWNVITDLFPPSCLHWTPSKLSSPAFVWAARRACDCNYKCLHKKCFKCFCCPILGCFGSDIEGNRIYECWSYWAIIRPTDYIPT